ncbi:MAG: tetratricopeptide repeat protein [Myxococcota bacterium]|nr:tetratricopeptide repeat protein [Myxococcota bacterium]
MRCLDLALVCIVAAACAAPPADRALRNLQEAEAALAEGSPARAADAFQRALDAAPGDLRGLRGLLTAQLALRDGEAALVTLAALEARDPEAVDPCPVLALAVGRSAASAERLARRAVEVGCPGARGRLARVLTSKAATRERVSALGLLVEAIDLDPSDPGRYRLAAELLIAAGRVEDSIALLATGLERHPEDRILSDLMVRVLSIR